MPFNQRKYVATTFNFNCCRRWGNSLVCCHVMFIPFGSFHCQPINCYFCSDLFYHFFLLLFCHFIYLLATIIFVAIFIFVFFAISCRHLSLLSFVVILSFCHCLVKITWFLCWRTLRTLSSKKQGCLLLRDHKIVKDALKVKHLLATQTWFIGVVGRDWKNKEW